MPQGILVKELSPHPNRIGQYPATHCQIMKQFRSDSAGVPCEPKSQQQGRNRHAHTQCFEIIDPGEIFYQPKYNM